MTGVTGKSGGARDGAGRPRSRITIRLGDQFYCPMRGLAEVVEVGTNRFVVTIDDDRIIFMARSRANSARGGRPRKDGTK